MTTPQPRDAIMVSLAKIKPGYNPRRYFDRRKHEELVGSIRLRGIIQPMLVRPSSARDGTYSIVVGGRRYRASIEVYGPDAEVPVIIREMTDLEALEAAIDENEVRDDTSETEQADAAVRALAAYDGDRQAASARLGWSRSKLDRRLALANLSDAAKFALDERRIKIGHAELLAAIPADKQDKALETILASGLDVAKTRDLLMRVTQNLANACFDKSDCMTCPFNSGTQRALFETHVDDGHCTNPGCFGLKTEAFEKVRLEEQERAAEAARAAAPPADDDDDDGDEQDDAADEGAAAADPQPQSPGNAKPSGNNGKPSPSANVTSSTAHKATVTVKSIAQRTAELREATWRTALARALAGNSSHAHTAILVAAMSGTLSQIKAETLTGRAGLLVGASFTELDYKSKIAAIRGLSGPQAAKALSAIGAAYARDVHSFAHVADLATVFNIDLRDSWQVDKTFLDRYTKDELKFVAQECGLIGHMGEKAFAKLLGAKKADLIAGMLNRIGFDWAGRLPSSMTLDGQYGSPLAGAARRAEPPITEMAA